MYSIEVSYSTGKIDSRLDNKIIRYMKAAGAEEVGRGAGFGHRDLEFYVETEERAKYIVTQFSKQPEFAAMIEAKTMHIDYIDEEIEDDNF